MRFAKSGGRGSRGVPLRNVILLTIWLLSIALLINGKKRARSKFYNGEKSADCVQGHFCSCTQKGISDFGGIFAFRKKAVRVQGVFPCEMHFRAAKPHKSAIEYSTCERYKICCFRADVCRQTAAQNASRIISRLNLAELEKSP